LRDELAGFQQGLHAKEEIVERLRKSELEHTRLEKDKSALQSRIEALEEALALLMIELEDLNKIVKIIGPLKEKIGDIRTLEKKVVALRKAEIIAGEKKRLEEEFAGLKSALTKQKKTHSELETEIKGLNDKLKGKETIFDRIRAGESAVEKFLTEHREVSSDLKVVENKLSTVESQKQEISELGPDASCKLCLRPFAEDLADIEKHFNEEISSLTLQTKPIRRRLNEIEEEGRQIRNKLKQDLLQKEQVNKYEQELASRKAAQSAETSLYNDSLNRVANVEKRMAEIGSVMFDVDELRKLEKAQEEKHKQKEEYIRLAEKAARKPEIEGKIKETREAKSESASKLKKIDVAIKELGFDLQAYQSANNELTLLREKVSNFQLEIERTGGQSRLISAEAARLEQKLNEYEKSKEEISQLRQSLTYLEKLSILFTEFRLYLIGRIRPSLSKQTSQLFYQMTGGRYQEIELDEDYNLRLYDRGERFQIVRFSGGEIDLANLCFRLAISIEMAASAGIENSFIILDEIFGSQDADRQRLIIEGLGRLKNVFRQIVIISHIDDVKELAEHIVEVEVDRSGISRAILAEGG
jgi:exonuclease SbcC